MVDSVGELARELLVVSGFTFLIGQSKVAGEKWLAVRTVGILVRLGPVLECSFCLGFWVALASRLSLYRPEDALRAAGCGWVLGAAAAILTQVVLWRRVPWRLQVGGALLGALAAAALAAVPVATYRGGLVAVPREFLSALGDASFAYAVHHLIDGEAGWRVAAGLGAVAAALLCAFLP